MYKYLIFFFSTITYSQTLSFTISDEQDQPISNCNILFKEKTSNVILEFTKINNGKGIYSLKKSYDTIIIEVQSVGYISQTASQDNTMKDKTYAFNFVLKSKTVALKEVVVESKKTPYKVKKDTVVYDVNKYRDGSEKKVEDLLKKLPGIEVDGNGSIKYKGKQVETVTLDGDNLFNSNYKLGTKNINIDMVEQIEAIENYTNNKLLKGIESDGKVALNLKLNKGKSDYSGNLENALGLKNNLTATYYSNSYVMQISSRIKSFSTVNFNNIGRSDAYFYEKQNSKSLDKKSEDDFRTKKILSDDLFAAQLDPIRYNSNNQFYISYNNLFKINKKLTLKSNLNFIDDKINAEQNLNTKNFINTSVIETNDNFISTKKPKVFTGEFELKINTTNATLLEVFSKQYLEKTKLFSDYTKNNQLGYSNTYESNSYFSLNKLVHTWKVSSNKALQANLYYTFDKIPQNFTSLNNTKSIKQESEFKKTTFLINYNLIGKSNNLSYTVQIGSSLEKTPYFSENSLAINNSLFLKDSYFSHSRFKLSFKNFNFIPSVSLTNYKFSLENNIPSIAHRSNNLIFEPALNIDFRNKKSTFTVSYSNTQKPISEEYIFTNNVFVTNRTTILNQPSFDFKKTNSYLFNYFYNDLYLNTTLNFSTQFQKSNGQYLSDFAIDENFTTIKNTFYYEENSSFNSSVRFSKFLEKMAINLIYTSSFIKNEYPNFLNSSDIRKNSTQIVKNAFEIRTGFNTKINFGNMFSHNTIQSKSIITKNVSSVQNSFETRYKISKKSKTSIKWDLFAPDLKNKTNSYNFIDFEYQYKLNDKINFIFVANNLLNLNKFNQIENNDFSTYVSKTNLTQRFFLLNIEYNF